MNTPDPDFPAKPHHFMSKRLSISISLVLFVLVLQGKLVAVGSGSGGAGALVQQIRG